MKQEAEQAQRAQAKMLKALMYGLVNVTGDPLKSQMAEFRNRREVAILITDLQVSTMVLIRNQKKAAEPLQGPRQPIPPGARKWQCHSLWGGMLPVTDVLLKMQASYAAAVSQGHTSMLQDSTPQAAKNPVAFKKVIEIHNTVSTVWLFVGWASGSIH